MKNLVPIKVKIGLRANGHADHPDWHRLPLAAASDPASHMFFGWKYDKTCGHKEEGIDSPYGMQWGMLFVTKQFAIEAKQVFPALVTELTEAEADAFWNDKAYAHMPENKVDNDQLQALKNELILRKEAGLSTVDLIVKIKKALDVDDTFPGLQKNHMKTFALAKQKLGLNIVPSE
ncbi:MAG TPA: hypothetical protein ENH41_03530 [Candidatus Omnitrophica bacterium]|nr:hypothetical protein [Candidatus Omnitrophota bacterium]